ncbi:secondary thiamine-phosphate synthase enzyme YjbQ [Kordiimonas lacus]|uniref:Secondary thiamine-phosphate synthase enzyme n=1 Tax=Kordiimonas lacus TaxID=637679 RepID=A0A1G6T542_9PROT|nr:secondary thiamine-phosphate synthase enzyme YjbQ [Kordiimonas lacus]SDD24280.1 secondary thiamine-phosphate synthase enzyme [Kordiimonas lacus]
MRQEQTTLRVATTGQGCFEITRQVSGFVAESGIDTGLLTLFIQHTSASLTIQENADPDVQADLTDALGRLAPEDMRLYRHTCEGPDDMPAHVKAAVTDVSLNIPVMDGRPVLGTWQGIYVLEHRRMGHTRRVVCHLMGD